MPEDLSHAETVIVEQLKDYLRTLSGNPVDQVMMGTEIRLILEALNSNHSLVDAARALNMSRAALYNKIHRYGIHRVDDAS